LGQKNIAEGSRGNRLTGWNDEVRESLTKTCKDLAVDASISLYMLEYEVRIQRVVNLLNNLKLERDGKKAH
jgi:hypothetical protein